MKPPSPTEIEAALRRLTEKLVAWGALKVILFGKDSERGLTAARSILATVDRHLPPAVTAAI